MSSMSESLDKLAARVRKLEESASAVREKNRAVLQERRQAIEEQIDSEVKDFQTSAADTKAGVQTWWEDTKGSVERQIAAMRADHDERKFEHQTERMEHRAERAEDDAAAAIVLAAYAVDAAEWAVVDAALSRAEADEFADR